MLYDNIKSILSKDSLRSKNINKNIFADCISCIIITGKCSSKTLKKIDKYNLKPDKFCINGKWN